MYSKVLVCAYIKLATYKEYYNDIFLKLVIIFHLVTNKDLVTIDCHINTKF